MHSKKRVEAASSFQSFNLQMPVSDVDGHDGNSSSRMATKLATCSKVQNILDSNMNNRKYVDSSFSFHTVNVAKGQAEPKVVGIWECKLKNG